MRAGRGGEDGPEEDVDGGKVEVEMREMLERLEMPERGEALGGERGKLDMGNTGAEVAFRMVAGEVGIDCSGAFRTVAEAAGIFGLTFACSGRMFGCMRTFRKPVSQ
jgi:hypothetical protein